MILSISKVWTKQIWVKLNFESWTVLSRSQLGWVCLFIYYDLHFPHDLCLPPWPLCPGGINGSWEVLVQWCRDPVVGQMISTVSVRLNWGMSSRNTQVIWISCPVTPGLGQMILILSVFLNWGLPQFFMRWTQIRWENMRRTVEEDLGLNPLSYIEF